MILPDHVFTNDPAIPILLRGDELLGMPILGPSSQGFPGISGSESFEDFQTLDPAPVSLPGRDFGGDILISDFIENWQQDPVNFAEFSNQRVKIKEIEGKKGILLYGTHTNTGFAYGDAGENQDIGPSQLWFPLKSEDADWQSLRFGILAGLDAPSSAAISEKARIKIGLSNQPTPKYQFRRFEGEIYWGNIVWSSGDQTWNISDGQFWRGGFQDYANAGEPNHGMNIVYSNLSAPNSQYMDLLGWAGTSLTGIFIEFEKAGSDPSTDGLNIKMYTAQSNGPMTEEVFIEQMKMPLNGMTKAGYFYRSIGNITSDSGSWSDFNYLSLESWSRYLWIDLVAYQVMA